MHQSLKITEAGHIGAIRSDAELPLSRGVVNGEAPCNAAATHGCIEQEVAVADVENFAVGITDAVKIHHQLAGVAVVGIAQAGASKQIDRGVVLGGAGGAFGLGPDHGLIQASHNRRIVAGVDRERLRVAEAAVQGDGFASPIGGVGCVVGQRNGEGALRCSVIGSWVVACGAVANAFEQCLKHSVIDAAAGEADLQRAGFAVVGGVDAANRDGGAACGCEAQGVAAAAKAAYPSNICAADVEDVALDVGVERNR